MKLPGPNYHESWSSNNIVQNSKKRHDTLQYSDSFQPMAIVKKALFTSIGHTEPSGSIMVIFEVLVREALSVDALSAHTVTSGEVAAYKVKFYQIGPSNSERTYLGS